MSSKGEVKRQQINLRELIEDTAALAIDRAENSNILVNLCIRGDAETAYADPVLLQQVVFNLLRNAAEAMSGSAGTINVRSSAASPGETMIAVEDTGPGLDREVAANLFTAFVTTKTDGMGVGLSICRTIIEKSGGRIWAASDSAGTTFFFTLPTIPDHPDDGLSA
jgi:two-component system sensor kinase FixL